MQWNIPASFAQFAETISSMARLQFAKKLPLGIWGAQPPQAYITPFTPSYAVCISGLSTANQMTAGFVAWMSSDLAGTNIVSQKKCGAKWDANTASYVQDELIVFDSIDGSQSTYYYWVAVVDTIGNISNATGPVAYAAGQSFGVPVDYAPTFSQGSSGIKLSANPSIPAASQPTLGSVAGGSLAATTYYVQIAWIDAGGVVGLPSTETSLAVAANELLTVTNAAAPSWAASWNVYAATASGYETLQNTTPIPIGTAVWTEPTGGLTTTGATPPTTTTMTPQSEGVLMYNAYWNTLNNAPSSTTAPNLPSSSDATWSISMTSGETAYIWVQSIDVEGLTTEWISLGSFTNGTLDAVADGVTYARTVGTALSSGVPNNEITTIFPSIPLAPNGQQAYVNKVGLPYASQSDCYLTSMSLSGNQEVDATVQNDPSGVIGFMFWSGAANGYYFIYDAASPASVKIGIVTSNALSILVSGQVSFSSISGPHQMKCLRNNTTGLLSCYLDGILKASVTDTTYDTSGNQIGVGATTQAGYISNVQVSGSVSLDQVPDGANFLRVTSVSAANQATTGSIEPGAIAASVQQSVTTYVNITSSGQIASATITPTGGYVRLIVSGAIASTNATAIGWSLFFYKNGTQMTPSFQYQVFDSAEAGNSAYKAFSFCILDTSPGTSSATYSATVTTNTNGTVSLIPVVLIVENMKV